MTNAPLVGLLYNPAVPVVLDALGARMDFIEVIPDRLWYDFGAESECRFSYVRDAVDELRRYARDRPVIGHGIGLSLPSAMQLDQSLLRSEERRVGKECRSRWSPYH